MNRKDYYGEDSPAMVRACLSCTRTECNGEICRMLRSIRAADTERPRRTVKRKEKPYMAEAERLLNEGKSGRQIAEILGMKTSTIHSWMNRRRMKLYGG